MRTRFDIDRDEWARTGRAVLRGVLDVDEVDRLETWCREIEEWGDVGAPGLHHHEQTDVGPRIARSEDLDPHHDGLSAFLRRGPLTPVLRDLFSDEPRLFKEKINYKHPGGAGFAPHQDATAYRFVDHHISVAVPLDPATEESGCLWFAEWFEPGTILPNEAGRIHADWCDGVEWLPVELEPGDVAVFDSYAPHRSATNRSDRSRRALYVTYNAAADGDWRTTYYDDKATLLDELGDGAGERVRISVNDDFLGIPVDQQRGA